MSDRKMTIMYGSQTGQAEAISEIIHEASSEHGIKSTLLCLKEFEKAFQILDKGRDPVVFVCSTTGDGELPENARKFMRSFRSKPIDFLSSLDFALLGLGDTNYSTFCGGPKTLERGLKKFQAKSFYETGYADDGTDLELVVEPWIEGLWPALDRHFTTKLKLKNEINYVGDDIMDVDQIVQNDITVELQKLDLSSSSQSHHLNTEYGLQMGDPYNSPFHTDLSSESKANLTLSAPMQSYLAISPQDDASELKLPSMPSIPYPLAEDDQFYSASVQLAVKLTKENAVKDTLCLALRIPDEFSYEPGDSFGICISNPKPEVDWLLERLKLTPVADQPIRFAVRPDCTKKNPRVPKYIPELCTRRCVLENLVEIRSVPKRTLLRVLLDFTTDETDRKILTQLSCKEGMQDFQKYVRIPYLNLLDILASLPSCLPPFEVLIEHLPRLQARLYSAASSKTTGAGLLRFAFNVINLDASEGRMYARKGLATGTLEQIYRGLQPYSPLRNKLLSNSTKRSAENLVIFKTKNKHFRLPPSPETPVIMVGPGSGVSPFIGFLEELRYQKFTCNIKPKTWLFFGCRHEQRDFLFREELKSFVESGTLSHLVVSFSRDKVMNCDVTNPVSCPKYVQDNIRLKAKEIADLLLRQKAILYVCGDAKNMSVDVKEAVVEVLEGNGMSSREEALATVKMMVKEGRYKEDVW